MMMKILPCSLPFAAKAVFRERLSFLQHFRGGVLRACLTLLLCVSALPAGAVDLLVSNFTDTPDPAVRGGTLTYSATITNNAADTAHDVALVFDLDPDTTFVSVSDSTNCSYASGKVTCSYATVNGDISGPDTADVITVNVAVQSNTTAGSTVNASATVSTSDTDTASGNNTLSQLTTIDDGADLAFTLTPNPTSVVAAGTVSYTAATVNNGPNAAGTVTVTTTLSPNITYQSASGSGWSCGTSGQVVTCTRSSAAVGALPDITITGKETGAVTGTVTTTGVVAIGSGATDYNNANDASTANITVTTGTDLAITKTASSGTPSSGLPMTFTLLPRNLGPFSASSVTVTDTLPAGFTGISASGSGWTCGVTGQTVTCTAASYAVGATNNIIVSATAPTVLSSTNFTNTAQISSSTADPISGNNTGSVSVNVLPDGVDLSITKTRTPDPVAQGSNLTNVIKVKNNGPQNARTGEITMTDTLPTGESYVSYSGSNWTCGAAGQVVSCTYNAALNNGSTTSTLTLTTTAVNAGTLTNSACASYTDSTAGGWTDPVSGNNCASASVQSTVSSASVDLMIAKTVDQDPLVWNASPLTYTLTVTNAGPGDATGVVVTDAIPGYKSGATGITTTSTGGTATATFNCTTGSTVTCTQTGGTIAAGMTKVFTIAVARPMYDSSSKSGGKFTNTATVTSTDQGDIDLSNNSASVQVQVDPVVDVTMQNSVTPTSAQAGTNATYVLTVNNNGPSTAKSVTVSDVFTVSAGTMTFISATPSTGTCASFDTGTNTLNCSLGDMTEGATATVTIVVRPDYMSSPPSPRTIDNTATVSTTTQDSNTANNAASSTLTVTQASLDLLVNNTDSPDPLGFVPASASPVFPDNVVTYHNVITNRGPSVASGLVLTYTMTPPSGKAMTFLGDKLTSSGQSYSNYCNNLNSQVTGPATLTITCTFPANFVLLAGNATTDLYLDFQVDTNPASTGDSFASTVSITSNEPESLSANNSASQTTTVRMRSDLQLAKSARAYISGADAATSTVQVRQPFYWVLTLTNAGPGDSQVTQITDTLPSGIALYTGGTVAPYNAAPYNGGVTWSTNNGTPTSGTCTGATTLSCSIGLLESGKVATVLVPVVSSSNGTRNNCASATTSEVDPNSANNTTICNPVTVQKSSIAGTVYSDLNNNGAKGTGETGISGVTVTLNGTDAYGNAVTNVNKTTDASGNFKFDTLTPGTYALSETQPSSYLDGIDAAGTSGGTASGAGADAISSIALAGNTAATGYLFGELKPANISGYAFIDANGNATRDGSETTGIFGVTITLTGTDDLGAVSTTATTGSNGAYTFSNLRPGSYQVEEEVIAGVTHTGMTVGSKGGQDGVTPIAANTAVTGSTKRTVSAIPVVANDTAQNYNFGESGQGLSGYVYADLNGNGTKDGGEPGIAGVSVTLSGTTSGGDNVCVVISPNPCTVTTGADGSYSFAGIPASNGSGYALSEQPQANAPLSGYGDGAETVGSLGGSAATNDVLSGVVINVGQTGSGYNFGERSSAIAGLVYYDKNNNGANDSTTDPALAGVTVTLSGLSAAGTNVCSIISSCVATTAADGTFSFVGLPASNGSGYKLTETQPAEYGERSNTAGTAGGTASVVAGNSVISGIALTAGTSSTGYLFGEKAGSISGTVYLDPDNSGTKDSGETAIAGVTVTLTGTDIKGGTVNLSTTTSAGGAYSFAGLLSSDASGYTVTEVQPAGYVDGKTTIAGGNPGSATASKPVAAAGNDTIASVVLTPGNDLANYNFGELPVDSIAGTVFADVNNNGAKDSGDSGISGVVLHLTGNDIRGAAVNLSTTTAADGSYTFSNLLPSNGTGYTITEAQPTGYLDGKDTAGTSGGTAGAVNTDAISAIVLSGTTDATGYLFAEVSPASLAGYTFIDANGNGLRDGGEVAGVSGVTITLTGTDDLGAVSTTATTGTNGAYTFSNLRPGSYQVQEAVVSGLTHTGMTVGSKGGQDGASTVAADTAVIGASKRTVGGIVLATSDSAQNYNFGESGQGLSGFVYADANGNGSKDTGESGIAGVSITLSGSTSGGASVCATISPNPCTVTTAADGSYGFAGLPASNGAGYTLTEQSQASAPLSSFADGAESIGSLGGSAAANDVLSAIVLGVGQVGANYNFGEKGGSIAGLVYHDKNDNGVRDAATDPGIAGTTVTLSGTTATGANVCTVVPTCTATTAADGSFSIVGLPASDGSGYTLTETQPSDYAERSNAAGSAGGSSSVVGGNSVISGIVLSAGNNATSYLFGEKSATIGGFVYLDINNSGTMDGGETGLTGVTLTLTGSDSHGTPVSLSTTTTAGGAYSFVNLLPSNGSGYTITETQPSGYIDGKTTIAGGNPGTASSVKPVAASAGDAIGGITPAAGSSLANYNFGEFPISAIAGIVFADANNNGVQDGGDAGISGVTLHLTGTDIKGDAINLSATTSADGSYAFPDLLQSSGGYTITETQPSGYLDGKDSAGTAGGTAAGAGSDTISGIALAANTNASGYLFAELAPASLSGYAFIDANGNGQRDGGELSGITGVSITLTGTDELGAVNTTVTTGANGAYTFSNLRPGTYQVQEAVVPGLTHTGMTVGSKGGQDGASTVAANTAVVGAAKRTVSAIALVPADAAQNYNFGEGGQGLSGFVYADLNGNGVKDAGEHGIQGVSVTLSGTTIGGTSVCATINPSPCSVTTGADGAYAFTGLPASNGAGYTLTEQSQSTAPLSSYTDGAEAVGSLGGSAAINDVLSGIVMGSGQSGANYNFGETGGSIAGIVYHDKNDNGLRDSGEPGIAGVTVTLSGVTATGANVCSVVSSCTATTAADGSFTLIGIPAANGAGYTLTEAQPAEYAERTNAAGNAGGSVSVVGGNSTVSGIALVAGNAATGYLFGEKSGTLSGYVYLDVNNNGSKDGGETGIAGVVVKLTGTDSNGAAVDMTATTLAGGGYSFLNLLPSNGAGYTITETQPTGYIDGKTTVAGGNPGTASSTKPVAAGAGDVIGGVVFAAGGNLGNYNFGEFPIGSISGNVFADENDNGIKDGDDYGLGGVVLHLTGIDIKGDAINQSATTAADGTYTFTNLLQPDVAGYAIHETQPAVYTDGKDAVADGNSGAVTSTKPVATGGDDVIGGIALAPGAALTGYNFAEKSAGNSVSGFVYVDTNDNGLMDGGETGIADTKLVLTGSSDTGATISRSVNSGANGSFTFTSLPPSGTAGYSITETQPPAYTDGKTSITGGAPGTASTAKPVSVGNVDVIGGVKLVFGHDLSGYLFGEKSIPFLKPPIVNGYVWLDRDHSRVRPVDGSQQGAPGWTVQLKQNGTLICTTNTDGTGFYQFDNLHCPGYEVSGLPTGSGFSITFSKDGTNLPAVPVSGGNKGTVPPTGGQITNITLNPSDAIVEQNLPLDPAGVVYDALTRQPVSGATVTITGPAGFDPATQLVGGTAAQSQVVGSDGLYQFLLQNAFPSGVYTLSVAAPGGYQAAPSSILPACTGVAVVGLVPTPALVQASNTAPAVSVPQPASPAACVGIVAGGAPTTQYYFSFNITNGGSAPILNNHIPLDPVSAGAILVTKTTPMVNVARGDLVPYTITATNTLPGTLSPVTLRDQMPPGFKYRSGSGTANGVPTEPTVSGRTLSWPNQSLAPKEKKTYTLVLVVGAGVGDGDYVNQAFALGGVTNTTISNLATATVRVVPDPTFDCPDVIGKVFDDKNANGYQDQGETGIPNVRLATPRGLLVTTDAEGRFHVPCPDIPNADRGSNFVMKLDDRTLPSGYRLTTENPRDVRITRGKLVKLNFGATIHRVVRIELADAAFEAGKAVLRPEWNTQIDIMIEQLKAKPSVVRIAYKRTAEAAELAAQRVTALRDEIERRWHALDGMYPLAIETEDAQ